MIKRTCLRLAMRPMRPSPVEIKTPGIGTPDTRPKPKHTMRSPK